MNDEQYQTVVRLLRQIESNTRPPGKIQRVFELVGLGVTIAGGFSLIQQIIQEVLR